MDRERGKRSQGGAKKDSNATSTQRAKWASSSKFNKILGNLEKSIMNQFSSQQAGSGSNCSTSASKTSRLHSSAASSSVNYGRTTVVQQSSKQCNDRQQRVQNISSPHQEANLSDANHNKITLQQRQQQQQQQKSETKARTTLNKYQQQIVSTMRPSQLIIQQNSFNNRLSIPPPHAKNQNHQLLLDGPSYDAIESSAKTTLGASDTLKSTKSNSITRHLSSTQSDVKQAESTACKVAALGPNLSPATSAKSSSVISAKQSGSQPSNKTNVTNSKANNDEEEESGFSTYQSRRSLTGNNSSTSAITSKGESQLSSSNDNSNSMILHAATTQGISLGPVNNFNHNAVNSTVTSQQFVYPFQHHHYQHQLKPSQQVINTQQQIVASNQVPIVSLDPNSNNGCYANSNQVTSPQRINNRSHQFSDLNQLYGLYGSNGIMMPSNQSIENGQQIYANAPPKPRRYQYYDSNQTIIPQMTATVPTKIATSSAMYAGSSAFIQHQQPFSRGGFTPQFNQQQQQQTRQVHLNQPFYNISHAQASNLYQQGVLGNERLTNPLNSYAYINHQRQFQRHMNLPLLPPPPHQLTKSKSSLDARDLIQYRHDRHQHNGHTESNVLHVKPQQQQQLIYSSRFNNNVNYHPTSIGTAQQQSSQLAQSNLQRSKSVTHLLPEYERHQLNQQARDWFLDSRQTATLSPKFLSVSSASTTNLNYAGLNGNHQQQSYQLQQRNQFAKISSQLNISYQQQHNDPIQQQGNHLSLATTLRQQQQRINNWRNIQAPPNPNSNFNNQQFQQQRAIINRNGTTVFSNNDKVVRQAVASTSNSASEDSHNKQGLDDKIRYLLIGKDNELNGAALKQNASSLIYHNKSGDNAGTSGGVLQQQQQAVWSASHQIYTSEPDKFTDRSHINEPEISSRMGNRQNHQYQVNNKRLSDSPIGDITRRKSDANSHLIVDLTTPRVLAKTQTTLVSAGSQDRSNRGDPWSINQVGLPQLSSVETTHVIKHRSITNKPSLLHQPQYGQNQINSLPDVDRNDPTSSVKDKTPNYERIAPYYYSDLKSEVQRQALLSIVQQKSLSPPPKLLSRSIDQSSTRLTPKSATLHSGHARLISENLASRQNRIISKNNHKYSSPNDFSSTSNITKNIDKLFESPVQPANQRINAVQSMLALNDCKDNNDSNRMSSYQTTSESLSSGYCSGEIKSKNFSKSKSLENISQKSSTEHLVDANEMGNPVYENIRRSAKLMNAINSSYLSTSTSQGGKSPVEGANSDESMDSILGSSLDESDTSLDIIDEIKISSTDNHLTDISQLIEQLKSNHSKLAEEYQSTLIRISKTIDDKSRDHRSEKLARRLQLLELKSKKYESRSKNQLALIQMMENVLKQTKLNDHSGGGSQQSDSIGLPIDNSIMSSSEAQDKPFSSCSSFHHQNVSNSQRSSPAQNATPSLSRASSATTKSSTSEQRVNISPRTAHGVIKAIVTETRNPAAKFVAELKNSDQTETRSSDKGTFKSKNISNGISNLLQNKSNAMSKKNLNTEKKNSRKNPFTCNDDSSSCSSSSSVEQSIRKQAGGGHRLHLMRDDDDFIEFLSTDGSSHRSSQFEASQFSASDFNTSTSASESSTSNACNDSLNSPIVSNSSTQNLFINGVTNAGILKRAKNGLRDSPNGSINNNSFESNNSNKLDSNNEREKDTNKFNNILGNVIDVDVCPMNNLSQCSPVNN